MSTRVDSCGLHPSNLIGISLARTLPVITFADRSVQLQFQYWTEDLIASVQWVAVPSAIRFDFLTFNLRYRLISSELKVSDGG